MEHKKISITLKKIIEITKGSFAGPLESLDIEISSISIDSRDRDPSDLYIALIGKNHDGNKFTKEVLKKGAKFAIISDNLFQTEKTILVETGKEALANIALYLRDQIKPKIIAITGSNGKTSTKEVIVSIMSNYLSRDQLLFTEGNYNNDIGLPLTLLNLKHTHSHAVLELGMSHAGEIAGLAKIAKPNIALITNIGEAHIQNFNSIDDIAEAKKELLNHSDELQTCILPRDDEYYEFLAKDLKNLKKITFGFTKEATINCKVIDEQTITIFTPFENFDVKINLLGKHNIKNILAACACSYAQDIPIKIIKKGIESIKPFPGRLEKITNPNGLIVINDTYNANPTSMREAIDVLATMKGLKILVIGDMGELGSDTSKYHKELGDYIKMSNIDFTLAVGRHTKITMQQLGNDELWFETKEDLVSMLLKIIKPESVILVKGSRFMEMEEVVNKIIL
ncbi:UDP-N-acetylmuramoyl-tripeptide--D-alanyl-D-alanine ligase [Methylophilaceae bacterium]|nr:UDP-N-acetylmuramoyl-tripeptide--D-alanyl-D-alanine ligase [Methylophilaceae bacterium]